MNHDNPLFAGALGSPFDLSVIWSTAATELIGWFPNFPQAKNRSKRQELKLIQRRGITDIRKPCFYTMGNKLVAHPALRKDLEQVVKP